MTNAELAILSLIAEQPRHGYELEGVIEARGMRAWTEIGFSSIYYLLNKLEKGGLIRSQLQQSGGKGPARKVYTITPQGSQAHTEAALAAISTYPQGAAPFLLGLSNFPALPRDQVLAALRTYANQAQARLEHMLAQAEAQQPSPPFVEAMFEYSRVLAQAELDWIRNFINDMETGNV